MPRTRPILALLALAGLSASAVAGQAAAEYLLAPPTPTQAATDVAITGLADQINRLPLGTKTSVGQYLDGVKGHPYMNATLQRAQLVGGARQLGGGVVQVRLDIQGRVVADALAQVAAVNVRNPNNKFKVTPELVTRESRAWSDRTFTAVGASNGKVDGLPAPAAAISPVALDAAKLSAAQGLIKQIETVPATPNKSTRDLLALPGVSDAVMSLILKSPVRAAELRGAGEVHVFLTIDKSALFDALRTSATRGGAVIDEPTWTSYRTALLPNIKDEIEGIALPQPPATAPAPAPRNQLAISTDHAPDWFFQSLEISASARDAGSKLVTGNNAEAQARADLQKVLEGLPLAANLTLGDAARRDRRFGEPIAAAMDRAHVYRVEYLEDGSASVKITTDARYLWQDIVAAAQSR